MVLLLPTVKEKSQTNQGFLTTEKKGEWLQLVTRLKH